MDNLQVIGSWHGIDIIESAIAPMLMSVKATAMNKGRARVWLESAKLAQYGFVRGASISVRIDSDRIVVCLDEDGDRIVAGRERNGKAISILDLCMSQGLRESVRGDSAKFNVYASEGMLIVVGA